MDLRDRLSEYPGALWQWQEPILRRAALLRRLALGSGQPAEVDLVRPDEESAIILDETL
jgi:hypothetical protein